MSIDIITIFDFVGTFAFAISGLRLAAAKHFDLFGAFVVGFITAVGGGTLRDVLLDLPPFWMQTPTYVSITGLALLFVIIFKKQTVKIDNTFFVFDAIGLGLFAIVGIEKSLSVGYPAWVAIIMGCITGAFGGILRDTFINEEPLLFRRDIYAMACIAGGILFFVLRNIGISEGFCQIGAAVSIFLTRILCVHFGVNLPLLTQDKNKD
ncbi:MAG: trimeric intracellular cation channel family protein [Bacteroidales bacterium]|nr:trimeric intracellular cation channel family protein [Bacteroidales bacterium]